jgi:hypothetical protein
LQVSWGKVVAAISCHPQHATGDFFRPHGSCHDFVQRFVSGCIVFVSETQFGVVEDGHQNIIELVSRRTDQLAKGGHSLCLQQFLLKPLDLSFQGGRMGRSLILHGMTRGCFLQSASIRKNAHLARFDAILAPCLLERMWMLTFFSIVELG